MNNYMKKIGLSASVLVLASVAAVGGWYWLSTGRYQESTDDAYVRADFTTISPKISGYVAEVAVGDNEPVRAGQVLVRIDPRDFQAALDKARASVSLAENEVSNLDARIHQQQSVIAQAQANVAASEASRTLARQDLARYRALLKTNYVARQQTQHADTLVTERSAQLERDKAALAGARDQIQVLKTDRGKAESQLEQSRAVQEQAQLDLDHTVIRAPIDGTVGARTVRVGKYVQAGTQLMAVVPLASVYVVANYKETQIGAMRPHQPVTLRVDAFPGKTLTGYVDSVAPASGLEFALLPPDNATGNFTKIVQRVPVKIVLDPDSALAGKLRPGMSVVSSVDTRGGATSAAPALSKHLAARDVAQADADVNL